MTKAKNRILLFASLLIGAAALLICSKSSPLYPMNDWVDVNCFFTVGRAMLSGQVPYRDLYEQKGPVLYFLYAVGALISRRSFFGVFLLDTVFFGLFLYFCGRIARLYLGDRPAVYAVVILLAGLIPTCRAFSHGGSVELISLWMLAYPLYVMALASRENRTLRPSEAMGVGLCAAGVLYIKFTMLGFFLGLCVYVAGWYLLRERKPWELLKTIGAFLGGMAALSAVVFGYFLIHGAVGDLLTVYFYNNLFLYPAETPDRLETIITCVQNVIYWNPGFGYLAVIGWSWLAFGPFHDGRTFSAVTLSFLGLSVGTYWGGRGYTYYGLVFAVYAVFGLIAAAAALCGWLKTAAPYRAPAEHKGRLISGVLVGLLAVMMPIYCWRNSQNVYLMSVEKEDMPQYRFAEIINTVEDATLLNYGFLDGGFYFTSDTVPNCRFFCTLNISLPEMWEEHRQAIESGGVDFVVTRSYPLERYSLDSSRYTCVSTAEMYFEGVVWEYYLYQLDT